jgi:hypothetical protein
MSLIGNTTGKAHIHENTWQTISPESQTNSQKCIFFGNVRFCTSSTFKSPIITSLQKLNTKKTAIFFIIFYPFLTKFDQKHEKDTKKRQKTRKKIPLPDAPQPYKQNSTKHFLYPFEPV